MYAAAYLYVCIYIHMYFLLLTILRVKIKSHYPEGVAQGMTDSVVS